MSGWRRLGIVLAVPIAAIAGLIGYENESRGSLYSVDYPDGYLSLDKQAKVNALWIANKGNSELRGCEDDTVRVNVEPEYGPYITCEKILAHRIVLGLFYAALTYAALAALGSVIRWVYMGFRPQK